MQAQSAGLPDVHGAPVVPFLMQVRLPQQVSADVHPWSTPMQAVGGTPQEQTDEVLSHGVSWSNTVV